MQESADPRETIPFESADRFELPFSELDDEFQELHDAEFEFRTFVRNVLNDQWCRENLEVIGDQGTQVLLFRIYQDKGAVGSSKFIPLVVKQLQELKRAG